MIQGIVIATLALIPAAFLPLTQDMFIPIKWTLVVGGSVIMLLLWGIKLMRSGTETLAWNRSVLGFLILSAAAGASLLISPNKIEALLDPFGLPVFVSLTILASLGMGSVSPRGKSLLLWTGVATSTIVGALFIAAHFQILLKIFPGAGFLSQQSFTPLGSSVAVPWFMLAAAPLFIHAFTRALQKKHVVSMAILIISAGIAATGVSLFFLLPPTERIALPISDAWAVTAETWKSPLRAITGVGSANFPGAFTRGRSPLLNTTPLWNIQFGTSSSFALHIATTLGLFGVLGLFFVARSFVQKPVNVASITTAVISIVVFLLAPPSLPVLILLAMGVIAIGTTQGSILSVHIPQRLSWVRSAIGIIMLVFVGAVGYGIWRNFMAETTFFRSLQARAAGDGKATYNLQIQTLNENPWVSRYHIEYSQTNIDLADAIGRSTPRQATASGQAAQGTLSDNDRQIVTNLIQQAIREAKIAVNLSPDSPIAWEHIGRLYHNLVNVAQGSDQWAVASYQRAIQLDPTNPSLRFFYASLLRQLGDSDSAFIQLQAAASLKPDYAIAHYNLAHIYGDRSQHLLEAREFAQTLQFLTRGSNDETLVRSELEKSKAALTKDEQKQLDQILAQSQTQGQSSLTSPIPNGQPAFEPKIKLPTEASPGALPQR